MNIYLIRTLTVLHWIVFPVYWLLYWIVYIILVGLYYILKPFYGITLFLLQPIIFFGRAIATCAAWPFQMLQKLETIYIYLGIAGLVGLTFGLCLAFFSDFLYSTFRLKAEPSTRGPTAKQYRAAQHRKKSKMSAGFMASPARSHANGTPARGRQGLLSHVFHEEDESDF